MKQIIRLSLLCAAFAGFSAVFAGPNGGNNHFVSDCNSKKVYTKKTEINIKFNKYQEASIERCTRNIDDVTIPDSVGGTIYNIRPVDVCNIRNADRPIRHVPTKVKEDDAKKPKLCDEGRYHPYNTRSKKVNICDQFDKSSKCRITTDYNYLSADNFSSLLRSVIYNCNPFYYKEYPTSCGQVERGIYHNNGSIFYSVRNREMVTINIILPNGEIITHHFPD